MSNQPESDDAASASPVEPTASHEAANPATSAPELGTPELGGAYPSKAPIRIGSQRYGVKPPVAIPRPVIGSSTARPTTADEADPGSDEATAAVPANESQAAEPAEVAPEGKSAEPARNDTRGKKPKAKLSNAPRFNAEPAPVRKYPPPNIRSQLSPELEIEFLEALGEQSLDELVAGQGDKVVAELELESRHMGRVMSIHRDDIFVEIGGRQQGLLSLRNLAEPPEVGAMVEIVVARFNTAEGLYDLILPGGAVAVEDWSQVHEGLVVEARVTGHNKGGLECEVNRLRGFIPASQISMYRVEDLAQFVGQSMICVISEANPEKRNLVLSRRAVMEREKAEAKEKLLAELAPGQLREGTVRSLQDFGAFVDLGGLDGLIHISQLSWDRIRHASEVLEIGQKVRVKIQKIDPQTGKIGLAFRDLSESPWSTAARDFPAHTKAKGKVSRLMDFGAFVRLGPGVEGLIHISELSHKRVFRVSDVLQEGQDVEVMVLSVDAEQQRISLSLKALEAKAVPVEAAPEPEEVASTPASPKKRQKPLKGGIGGPSSGEKFGLKW